MYDRARDMMNGLLERKYELMVPIELDDPTTNTVSTTTVTVNYGLREPLCEDSSTSHTECVDIHL